MENRLKLNKRPTYELPDNTEVVNICRSKTRIRNINFKPDISINSIHNFYICNNKSNQQVGIKSNNKELIKFINNYNWNSLKDNNISGINNLYAIDVKKIILEEFYGVKYGK